MAPELWDGSGGVVQDDFSRADGPLGSSWPTLEPGRRFQGIPESPLFLTEAPDPAKMAQTVGLGEGDTFTMDGVRYHVDAVEPVEGEPGATHYRVSAL